MIAGNDGSPQTIDLAGLAEHTAGELVRLSDGPFADREHTGTGQPLPSLENIAAVLDGFRLALFPGYLRPGLEGITARVSAILGGTIALLTTEMVKGGCFSREAGHDLVECRARAATAAAGLLRRLPTVRGILNADIRAAWLGDPACQSPWEPVVSYPGVEALIAHRIAHELHTAGVPLVPRMLTEAAHGRTGIDIHPGARIGPGLFIDHGTGVVIGETCVIGRNVKLYQGVTLGAASFPLDAAGRPVKGIPRHPLVEDDVTIYAHATVLGRVTIGAGSVIGGNVWLTKSVPPGSRIYQRRARREGFSNGAGI